MILCISSTVSASFPCATIISANDGRSLVSGHASGCHRPERTMHFGQWDSTCKTSMTRMCSGPSDGPFTRRTDNRAELLLAHDDNRGTDAEELIRSSMSVSIAAAPTIQRPLIGQLNLLRGPC